MVKYVRRVAGLMIVTAFLAVAGALVSQQTVHAEDNFQFPGITRPSENWNFSARSPDPGLTWLYRAFDSRHPNRDEQERNRTQHILRNRSIGRNEGTRLRLYYNTKPGTVSFQINVTGCQLDAPNPFDGKIQVSLGGGTPLYNENTLAPFKADHWYEKREFLAAGQQRTTTVSEARGENGRFAKSPVCDNQPQYTVPLWIDREGCNNPGRNGICIGAGTGDFPPPTDKSGTKTINPPNIMLDGKVFTKEWLDNSNDLDGMGFDKTTGLFYADVDIDLTATNIPDHEVQAQREVMQRIAFKVRALDTGPTPKIGYRANFSEAKPERFFGIQGAETDPEGDWGQKIAIPLGMRCDSDLDVIRNAKIVIYDVDNRGFGQVYAMVFSKDPDGRVELLRGSANYITNNDDDHTELTESGLIRTTTTESGQSSRFYLRKMERGFQYMMVFVNPKSGADPSGNVYSLDLPTDSVLGLVRCDYKLKPTLTGVGGIFPIEGTLTPTGSIESDNATVAGIHPWRITRAVFSSRPSDLSRTDVMNSRNDEGVCEFIERRSGEYLSCGSPYSSVYHENKSESLRDAVTYPVGTYVCYVTSVKDPSYALNDNEKWAHSPMQCAVSAKTPKVQILGTDLKVGGEIGAYTSITRPGGGAERTFGSWVEYGIFSTGTNKVASSGSGLRGGNESGAEATWSKLTFANTASPYGSYGNLVMPNARSWFAGLRPTSTSVPSILSDATDNGVYIYEGEGTIEIDTSNISAAASGKSIIIQAPNGTVKLTGDGINVANAARTKVSEISQVVIVAENINIENSVKNVDAWLLATDTINTCSDGPSDLSSGDCNNQLTVSGAVMTKKLLLRRTAGADVASQDSAAEIFQLRPDSQLWAYNYANSGDRAKTVYVKELPPRF